MKFLILNTKDEPGFGWEVRPCRTFRDILKPILCPGYCELPCTRNFPMA